MMDYDGLTQQRWTNYWVGLFICIRLCEFILSKQSALKAAIVDRVEVINPPTQHQQISKSTVYSCCTIRYSTRSVVSWQIQYSASPRAIFATRPHPSCCILSYNTRNGALTSICMAISGYI